MDNRQVPQAPENHPQLPHHSRLYHAVQGVAEGVRMLIFGHSNPDVHKIYGHDEEAAIKSAILKLHKLTA